MEQNSKCPNCGGVMILNSEQTQFTCPYCNNIIYINPEPKTEPQPTIHTEQRELRPQIPPNVILFEKSANFFKGSTSLGGNLKFYSDRMYFKAHAFNFQKAELTIRYDTISYIEAPNTILANGLNITTATGERYRFVVSGRGQIVDFLYKQTGL